MPKVVKVKCHYAMQLARYLEFTWTDLVLVKLINF